MTCPHCGKETTTPKNAIPNTIERTCPICGTVHPVGYTKTKCKECHTELPTQICSKCKQEWPTDSFVKYKTGKNAGCRDRTCPVCTRKKSDQWEKDNPIKMKILLSEMRYRHLLELEKVFNEWLEAVNSLPNKPLTEAEWLGICSFFGGCAACGDEHIEVRQYFVLPKDGGKYAAHNVFPLCGDCATYIRKSSNPFKWFKRSRFARETDTENIKKLIDFLRSQLERRLKDV